MVMRACSSPHEAFLQAAVPGPVSEEDVHSALRGVKPTVAAREKYELWSEEFGSA